MVAVWTAGSAQGPCGEAMALDQRHRFLITKVNPIISDGVAWHQPDLKLAGAACLLTPTRVPAPSQIAEGFGLDDAVVEKTIL